MMRYAIKEADGTISNVVMADTAEDITLPTGVVALSADPQVKPGWTHDGVSFVAPPAGPPVVPKTISKLQLVRALRSAGHWGNVKATLAQADATTQEDWEYAFKINRSDPVVASFAAALGLTEDNLDDIFIDGAGL